MSPVLRLHMSAAMHVRSASAHTAKSTQDAADTAWIMPAPMSLTVSTRVFKRTMRFLTLRSLSSRRIVTCQTHTAMMGTHGLPETLCPIQAQQPSLDFGSA